jgi:transposase
LDPALLSRGSCRSQPKSDLDSWIAEKRLGGFVLEAVRRVNERDLRRVAAPDAGMAFRPLTLLALITYCYAVEIYGADEIEDLMRRDPEFRGLCRNEFPNSHLIRRFRRYNREAIHQSLVETFRQARQGNSDRDGACDGKLDTCGGWSSGADRHDCIRFAPAAGRGAGGASTDWPRNDQRLADEADHRIEKAMWIDLMTADV